MLRSDLVVGLIAFMLAACEQRSDLGGQKLAPECTIDCDTLDAGPRPMDAGLRRPDARFESAPREKLVELVANMEGTWWGFSESGNQVVDGVDNRDYFEVTFTREDDDRGTFKVRCLKPECEPFGYGSDSEEGGRFRILDVNPSEGAKGELSWVVNGSPELVALFEDIDVDLARGPALTFDVGLLNGGPKARIVRAIVLASGPLPGDGGGLFPSDSGLDAGAP